MSFEIVGSIAVLKASATKKDAKKILREIKNVKTVVKRVGEVSGPYRIKKVKYLAGEPTTETIHKENNCRFKVDLNKAYFSPRLQTERQRVICQVCEKDVVIDMFAGVGPYAIPMAKRAYKVLAIDHNPYAVRYLLENMRLNKVKNMIVYEGDALEIIRRLPMADKIVMNAPRQNNQKTLDAALKNLKKEGIIYFYIVNKKVDEINCRGLTLINKRKVIEYAPGKAHYCLELMKV